jgi:hypothetical protein
MKATVSPSLPPHSGQREKAIIRTLEIVQEIGVQPYTAFDDFLDIALLTLESMPHHAQAQKAGIAYQDPPEVAKVFDRIKARYGERYYNLFAQALGELFLSASDGYQDVIGAVYMEYGIPNKNTGQFFTPYHVAAAMAQMTMLGIERKVHDRIKEAAAKDPFAAAVIMAGVFVREGEAFEYFYNQVLPAVAHLVEPVTVCDCCCGSGVMLLAAASCTPRWALDFGLVRFFGQDIDETCVKMAKVNLMLYGLNGFYLRCLAEMTQADIDRTPEPFKEVYEEAKAAQDEGDTEKVEKIAVELRAWSASGAVQASLFGDGIPVELPKKKKVKASV